MLRSWVCSLPDMRPHGAGYRSTSEVHISNCDTSPDIWFDVEGVVPQLYRAALTITLTVAVTQAGSTMQPNTQPTRM